MLLLWAPSPVWMCWIFLINNPPRHSVPISFHICSKTDKHGTKLGSQSKEFSGWCGRPKLLSRESIYLEKTHQEVWVQTKASDCKSAGLWATCPIRAQTEAWAQVCLRWRSISGQKEILQSSESNRKVCVSVYYATQKFPSNSFVKYNLKVTL